jgi:hypothetical protein
MKGLISDKLVTLIENNADIIIKRWIERLGADPSTPSFSPEALSKSTAKAHMVIKELGEWIGYDKPKEEITRHYSQEGIGLFRMGIPLSEGVRALILLRRTTWLFILDSNLFESAMEMHQTRELNDRASLFFDRAGLNFIDGYMEEMRRRAKELWNVSEADLGKLFFQKPAR